MDKRTLLNLERYVQGYVDMARQVMESYKPYAILKPVAMLMNKYTLEYWVDGWQHGTPMTLKEVGWNEIVDQIMKIPPSTDLDLDFSDCTEWLVCFHLFRKRMIEINRVWQERPPYTEEREEQHKTEIVKEWGWTWAEKLWNGNDYGAVVRDFLTDMPEVIRMTAQDLQKVAQHIPID